MNTFSTLFYSISDAQATLVVEVKGALSRALGLQESSEKHAKIQALAGLICTMIESCPATQSQQNPMALLRPIQFNMNNMVKVMLKKGLLQLTIMTVLFWILA